MGGQGLYKKAKFYFNVSAAYALTLLFAASALGMFHHSKPPVIMSAAPTVPVIEPQARMINAGKPVRVILPRLGIDLPVDEGLYDTANQVWTLSGTRAQYATPSVIPNDYEGNTLIYGHNNLSVFYKLRYVAAADVVQVITDNGLVFSYSYAGSSDAQPNDLSVFSYGGKPTITIQTCAGSWNEIRRMYHFNFVEVHHV